MSVKRVTPREARELCENQGYAYLDVRSIPEYAEGHAPGAHNVPLMHMTAGRMTPNAEFFEVVRRTFAADAKIVVGCKSGGRSLRAAELLAENGYTNVVDMRGGLGGEFDPDGRCVVPGWAACELPVTTNAEPRKTYDDLAKK